MTKTFLERLRCRIEQAVRKPDPTPNLSFETFLFLLSVVYGGVMRLRARLYAIDALPSRALPCRVVSIGNLSAGGTGKTPVTIMLVRQLRRMGCRVVVLSRGYRGRMETTGGIVSDGQRIYMDPEEAGDEPYMMARLLQGVPILVGRDRYKVGLMAVESFDPDLVVLDDAFQHLRLKRDFDIVLLDSRSPYGNGHLLPRGMLREPLSALGRADAFVFTRSDPADSSGPPKGWPENRLMVNTMHIQVIRTVDQQSDSFFCAETDPSDLKGRPVVAFAGLADNDQFFAALTQSGCILRHRIPFADHHRYERSDLDHIAAMAEQTEAGRIVTSLKDFVKIEKWAPMLPGLVVVDVVIKPIGDADALCHTLLEKLTLQCGRKHVEK